MTISGDLAQTDGFRTMASELGISQEQAIHGADALLPAILGGFQKQMRSVQTQESMGGLLGLLGSSGLIGSKLGGGQGADAERGNDILAQIFGSKDTSRAVAQNASGHTGLDASVLKKMLPILVSLVTAYLARQSPAGPDTPSASGGGLGGMLGGLLSGQAENTGSNPLSGLGALLDANGDGNALDDIMRMAGKAIR